jgi:predicted benzoate:H+ symporter BenE
LHFALVAGLVAHFGAPAKRFLEQNFVLVTMILLALLLGGLVAFRYVS